MDKVQVGLLHIAEKRLVTALYFLDNWFTRMAWYQRCCSFRKKTQKWVFHGYHVYARLWRVFHREKSKKAPRKWKGDFKFIS